MTLVIFELFTLFSVGFLGALTPGPDILFTLRNTLNYGMKAGFLSLFGIFCGWIVFLSLIYFGFAHLIQGVLIQGILSAIGGIYLCYIAYLLFNSKPNVVLNSPNSNAIISTPSFSNKALYSLILKGFLLNLSNPKAILFFGLIITPFMNFHLALSLCVLLSSLITAFVLVIFLATFFRKSINDSLFHKIDKVCGIVFLGFAFLLFLASYRNFLSL
ncbi:LysE family translocator [Helicobacter turcicus]|uniref:LysE family translocator n=1 Tax=Helicobacter turcicus TaxID=2867412 RepID=A0ABS7JKL9_9HELI|nr:LysE family translocator [Helicobacter turcicus]MBX7489933.1 LysE family translocator [Helicobacter turcicus]MBX7544793.1 LysE family translocator [Helicobacter turcicus]